MFDNQEITRRKGKILMERNRNKFTLKHMTDKLDEIMDKHSKGVPTQVNLNLPKLQKSDTPKIQLPKLKKNVQEGLSA